MRTIDISMPVAPGMPSFPGDPEVVVSPVWRLAKGDGYNLSTWSFGSHTGTHVDPPRHFADDGATADHLDLDVLNGPCVVVDVDPSARAVAARDVARVPPGATRVLFRTANSARWARGIPYFPDYVALAEESVGPLLDHGVRLVGIDSLSIESDPSGRYPVHRRLLSAGALILEGLRLAEAPAGPYDLRCLPLRLASADGAPCRAVLVAP
ncbi:MAG TPA: cyclase family protein [Thermoplasmata archaeon]|nr:cyclase family protein [Thermoplasmata archaeon]